MNALVCRAKLKVDDIHKYGTYEGRRKSSRPNHEREVLGKILFAIFKRIHLSTLHILSPFF